MSKTILKIWKRCPATIQPRERKENLHWTRGWRSRPHSKVHLIRTCQWSRRWIGRKSKIKAKSFTLGAPDPIYQVCLQRRLYGDFWWWDWTQPRIISYHCPSSISKTFDILSIILHKYHIYDVLYMIYAMSYVICHSCQLSFQNHHHLLLSRDNLTCEETLQEEEMSF